MLLVVVEVQHLVEVLQSLGQLARITVAGTAKSVSYDQQIGIACRLARYSTSPPPTGKIRLRVLEWRRCSSAQEDRQQCVVTFERLRQGKGWMQAVPDFGGGPAS